MRLLLLRPFDQMELSFTPTQARVHGPRGWANKAIADTNMVWGKRGEVAAVQTDRLAVWPAEERCHKLPAKAHNQPYPTSEGAALRTIIMDCFLVQPCNFQVTLFGSPLIAGFLLLLPW